MCPRDETKARISLACDFWKGGEKGGGAFQKGRLLTVFLTTGDPGRKQVGKSEISSGGSERLSVDATDICYF